jgi:hypothetical protein
MWFRGVDLWEVGSITLEGEIIVMQVINDNGVMGINTRYSLLQGTPVL